MEAIAVKANEKLVDEAKEAAEAVRELTSLELALVGGGTANVAFM